MLLFLENQEKIVVGKQKLKIILFLVNLGPFKYLKKPPEILRGLFL
jgi:hypothetical protein